MPTYLLNPSVPSVSETGLGVLGISGFGYNVFWHDGTNLWMLGGSWRGQGTSNPDFYAVLSNLTTGQNWIVPGPAATVSGVGGFNSFSCYDPTNNKVYISSDYGAHYYLYEFDATTRTFTIVITGNSNSIVPIVGDDGLIYAFDATYVYSYNPSTQAVVKYTAKPFTGISYISLGCDGQYVYLAEWDGTVRRIYSCPVRLTDGGTWTEWAHGTSDTSYASTGVYKSPTDGVWYVGILQSSVVNYYSAINGVFTSVGSPPRQPYEWEPPSSIVQYLDLAESLWNYDIDVSLLYPSPAQPYSQVSYRTPRGSGSYLATNQASYTGPWFLAIPMRISLQNDGNTIVAYSPSAKFDYPTKVVTPLPQSFTPSVYGVVHYAPTDVDYIAGYANVIACYAPNLPWTYVQGDQNQYLPTDVSKPNLYPMPYGDAGNVDYWLFPDYDKNGVVYIGRNKPTDRGGYTYGDVATLNRLTGATAVLIPNWNFITMPNTPRANPTILTVPVGYVPQDGASINLHGITQSGWSTLNDPDTAYVATVIDSSHFSIPVDSTGFAADYTQDANGKIQPGIQYRSLCATADRSNIVISGNNLFIYVYNVDSQTFTIFASPIEAYPYIAPLQDGTILGFLFGGTSPLPSIIRGNPTVINLPTTGYWDISSVYITDIPGDDSTVWDTNSTEWKVLREKTYTTTIIDSAHYSIPLDSSGFSTDYNGSGTIGILQYATWRFNPLTQATIFLNGPHVQPGTPFGFGTGTYGRRQIKPVVGPDGYFWMFFGNVLYRISPVDGTASLVKDMGAYGQITFVNGGRDIVLSDSASMKALYNLLLKIEKGIIGGLPGKPYGMNADGIYGMH